MRHRVQVTEKMRERIVKRYVENPDMGWDLFMEPYRNMHIGTTTIKIILNEAGVRPLTSSEFKRINKAA